VPHDAPRPNPCCLTTFSHAPPRAPQLSASSERRAEAERELAAARTEAARSAAQCGELQKKLVWWQQELEGAQAEADLYANAAKAAKLEAARAASALKEGFSAAAAAFARGLDRSGSIAASDGAPGSASKRSARRWWVAARRRRAAQAAPHERVPCVFAHAR
jgi:hypothetical protein